MTLVALPNSLNGSTITKRGFLFGYCANPTKAETETSKVLITKLSDAGLVTKSPLIGDYDESKLYNKADEEYKNISKLLFKEYNDAVKKDGFHKEMGL